MEEDEPDHHPAADSSRYRYMPGINYLLLIPGLLGLTLLSLSTIAYVNLNPDRRPYFFFGIAIALGLVIYSVLLTLHSRQQERTRRRKFEHDLLDEQVSEVQTRLAREAADQLRSSIEKRHQRQLSRGDDDR
ncbi:hypothetical protein [Rhodococcoides fascians]|uniref:hypothetical protein n=1 Tax=Rhodococcoides fascians TaxID=1828 RepID=UPI00050C5DC2|nr:hypothetical protein [Rhodococcus fascians]